MRRLGRPARLAAVPARPGPRGIPLAGSARQWLWLRRRSDRLVGRTGSAGCDDRGEHGGAGPARRASTRLQHGPATGRPLVRRVGSRRGRRGRAGEHGRELGRGGRTVGGVLGHGLADRVGDRGGDPAVAQVGHLDVADAVEHREDVGVPAVDERRLPGEHGVDGGAEGVDVPGRGRLATREGLRRAVGPRDHVGARRVDGDRRVDQPGHAEVGQQRLVELGEQDVGRLDVAVEDPVLVDVLERGGEGAGQPDGLALAERTPARQPLLEGAPLVVRHDQVGLRRPRSCRRRRPGRRSGAGTVGRWRAPRAGSARRRPGRPPWRGSASRRRCAPSRSAGRGRRSRSRRGATSTASVRPGMPRSTAPSSTTTSSPVVSRSS